MNIILKSVVCEFEVEAKNKEIKSWVDVPSSFFGGAPSLELKQFARKQAVDRAWRRYQSQNFSGATGATGATGVGIPIGGTSGQVLTKNSSTNYDIRWADQTGGSSVSGTTSFARTFALMGV